MATVKKIVQKMQWTLLSSESARLLIRLLVKKSCFYYLKFEMNVIIWVHALASATALTPCSTLWIVFWFTHKKIWVIFRTNIQIMANVRSLFVQSITIVCRCYFIFSPPIFWVKWISFFALHFHTSVNFYRDLWHMYEHKKRF